MYESNLVKDSNYILVKYKEKFVSFGRHENITNEQFRDYGYFITINNTPDFIHPIAIKNQNHFLIPTQGFNNWDMSKTYEYNLEYKSSPLFFYDLNGDESLTMADIPNEFYGNLIFGYFLGMGKNDSMIGIDTVKDVIIPKGTVKGEYNSHWDSIESNEVMSFYFRNNFIRIGIKRFNEGTSFSYEQPLYGFSGLLDSIKVKKNPTKLYYNEGETFDPNGLTIDAVNKGDSDTDLAFREFEYNDRYKDEFIFEPSIDLALTKDVKEISITFREKTCTLPITVSSNDEEKINVVFDDSKNTNTVNVVKGEKVLKPNDPIKTGHIFNGWFNEKTNELFDFDTNVEEDLYLVAKWQKKQYEILIKRERNGLDSYQQTVICDFGDEYVLKNPDDYGFPSVLDGYKFAGWMNDTNENITKIVPDDTVSSYYIYAKWTVEIRFQRIDSTGYLYDYPVSEIKTYDKNLTLPNLKTINENIVFDGWYVSSNFLDEYKITGSEDFMLPSGAEYVKLYPKVKMKISFDLNSYGENPEPIWVVYGESIVLPMVNDVLGYKFNEWYISNLSGNIFIGKGGQSYIFDYCDKVYADFIEEEYNITYIENSGVFVSGYLKPTKRKYSESVNLPDSNKIKREGYVFGGWFLNNDFSGDEITTINEKTVGNKILYAKWIPEDLNFTISYILDGGEWVNEYTPPNSFKVDTANTIVLPTGENVKKTHYIFDGWFLSNDFTTSHINTLDGISKNITLYAKWIVDTTHNNYHMIYFFGNGGLGEMLPQFVFDGEITKINLNTFTRADYTFSRWKTENGIYFSNGQEISDLTSNLNLYAEWTKNANNSTYYSGGGSRGGGGGGGGGGGRASGASSLPNNFPFGLTAPTTTNITMTKSIAAQVDQNNSLWVYEPTTNKFKLNIKINGQNIPATNGFYILHTVETKTINNIPTQVPVQNTYYFDTQGNMVTGFLKTSDNKTYFFDNTKNNDEGKMIIGWKEIQGSWYYFNADGSMLINSLTPDGLYVGADGKWIKQ